MSVLVLGAAGMLGRKLVERCLSEDDASVIHGFDAVASVFDNSRVRFTTGDVADPETVQALVAERPQTIVHLAAIVSGEAEADFEKGYRVNMAATLALLEAIRAQADYRPRFVFASSIAVFGAPFPQTIGDTFHRTPRTSYGTQKTICELLVNDYTRRGIIDGLSLRLPTVCVRPGKPNAAASGFFSSIIREPLAGLPAVLPVGDEVVHWHASPRSTVGFLRRAMVMETGPVGPDRAITMPGVAVSVAEQLDALERVAGPDARALVRREPDEAVAAIVRNWPERFDAARAQALGFEADADFDAIIEAYIEDEGVAV